MKSSNILSIKFLVGVFALTAILTGCKNNSTADNSNGTTASSGSTGTSGTSGSPNEPANRPAMTATGYSVTGNSIKIGLIASLSGPQKPWGQDSLNGAKLAVEEFNAAGGVDGKKVEMDIQDSQSKPEDASTATLKALSDGCIGVVGEVASGNTVNIATACYKAGVPDVAIGATMTKLTQIGNNVFRVCYTDSFQGPVMATFAYNELGIHKVAILTDNALPYSQGLSRDFKSAFLALGGKVVDEEKYESGASSFTTQLTNLKAANPEGVFASGYFTEVGPIVASARSMGIKVPFFGGDGWDSIKILQSGGSGILGCYFCNHYTNMDKSPQVQGFLAKWKKAYGGYPGTTMGALGYDAMAVTLQALKNSKSLNSVDLRNSLANIQNFNGVSGVITLKGANGNPPKRALVVQIVPMSSEGFQKPVVAYVPGPNGPVKTKL